MEALIAMQTRNSVSRLSGEVRLEDLKEILSAGIRAPDHGMLRPWRISVIQGESLKKLGNLFADAKQEKDPGVPQMILEKLRNNPLRAPLILGVFAIISVESKIPEIEQVLSAGAVAQNILNAAHALGYGAIWRTGEMAYDDRVKTGLGLARPDKIVGFIYVGQIDGKAKDLPAVDERDIVDYW